MRTRHLAPEVGWLNIPHWSEKWPGTAAVVNPHGFRYVTDHHDELPLTDDDLYLSPGGWHPRSAVTQNPKHHSQIHQVNQCPAMTKRPFPPSALAPLPKTQYTIVQFGDPNYLREGVEVLLSEGWELAGGVSFNPVDENFVQALTRTN